MHRKGLLYIALASLPSDRSIDYIASPSRRRGHWLEIGVAVPQILFRHVARDAFGGVNREEFDTETRMRRPERQRERGQGRLKS